MSYWRVLVIVFTYIVLAYLVWGSGVFADRAAVAQVVLAVAAIFVVFLMEKDAQKEKDANARDLRNRLGILKEQLKVEQSQYNVETTPNLVDYTMPTSPTGLMVQNLGGHLIKVAQLHLRYEDGKELKISFGSMPKETTLASGAYMLLAPYDYHQGESRPSQILRSPAGDWGQDRLAGRCYLEISFYYGTTGDLLHTKALTLNLNDGTHVEVLSRSRSPQNALT